MSDTICVYRVTSAEILNKDERRQFDLRCFAAQGVDAFRHTWDGG